MISRFSIHLVRRSANWAVCGACLLILSLSAAEKEPARVIVFGTVERFTPRGAPVRGLDDAAFDQDLAETVAKAAELPFRFVEKKTFPEVMAAFERGEIDVIPSLGRVPERQGRMLFSVRHTVSAHAVFVREGTRPPASLAEVESMRLVVVADSSAMSYVNRKGWGARVLVVATTADALRAVQAKRADGCLVNQLVGISVLRELGLERAIMPGFNLPDYAVDYCMAVRKSDGELLTRLNDGILLATERGDLQRNREKWLPVFESYWLSRQNTRRWIGAVAAGLVLVAGLGWLWHRARLRAEHRLTEEVSRLVEARTRELEQANARLRQSEEAVRGLNSQLEGRVADRTAELAARVAEVERLNAELEAFSFSVSHDLRAPLRNIAGFIELLTRRSGSLLDAEGARYLATVAREAGRLGTLIDDLLAFSRINRTELTLNSAALGDLVDEVREELRAAIGERRVEWKIGELPTVRCDRGLVRQVLANLMGNAVKFTRGREVAVIEIGTLPATTAGEATFFVRDNGAGFNPKYLDKLFGVFQRLHNSRDFEGTGIGLANVKRIVERHGGRVWAEGAVERGATFYFTLPRSAFQTERAF